jgi:hypothetical protein
MSGKNSMSCCEEMSGHLKNSFDENGEIMGTQML